MTKDVGITWPDGSKGPISLPYCPGCTWAEIAPGEAHCHDCDAAVVWVEVMPVPGQRWEAA